uniref:Uncharacterized protein n=1 Tax=Picea sitchensis TaxID=3332 RepID=D5A8Q0_PICSI|nr:unknown [Picea sitchensis]
MVILELTAESLKWPFRHLEKYMGCNFYQGALKMSIQHFRGVMHFT